MVSGHVGVAFAARARGPSIPMGWLLAATVAPDLVDYAFVATGTCNLSGLYSHSLPAIAVAGTCLGAVAAWRTRSARAGLVVAVLVVLHLAADFVTGRKLLWAGGPTIGLAAYDYPALDFVVELPIVAGGWWILRRTAGAPQWAGSIAMLVVLLIAQVVTDFGGYRKPNACVTHDADGGRRPLALALASGER